MRIAILHLGFFYSGGGEKLVLEEIRGLRGMGHEVNCYAPYVDRSSCFPDYPEIQEIRSLLPPPPKWLPMHDPLWVVLASVLVPLLAYRFRKYDVLIGANQPGPWLACVLGKLLGKPYIIYLAQPLRLLHLRDIDLANGIRIREGDHHFLMTMRKLAGWIIDKADRISVRNASVVLTNGEHVGRWIHEVYGVRSINCAAGCHPLPAASLRYEARWSGEIVVNGSRIPKPYILLTNRHSPMKRFEYAIWAMKTIHREAPGITLVITGQETEYTDQLRYLVEGLLVKDVVKFVGLVAEDELGKLYRGASAYVYPSPEEDFGMGIVEAMGAGTPVVAWANGGPTVTVRDKETGFLVEPYDTDQFAARLLTLASNPPLSEKMGREANLRARTRFSYDQHNRVLEEAALAAVSAREVPDAVSQGPASNTRWLED